MGILDLSWKQIIAFHGFEVVYLAVLGVLPFIVWQPLVLTCCILLFGSILVISLYKKISYKKIEVKGQGVVITGCDTGKNEIIQYLPYSIVRWNFSLSKQSQTS